MKTRFLLSSALILGAVWSCRAQISPPLPPIEPAQDTVWTATREVRDLLWDGHALWAATGGGVLRDDARGWRKWTRKAGLPANEAVKLRLKNGQVEARFPVHSALFIQEKWVAHREMPFQNAALRLTWNGQTVSATLDGLQIGTRKIALPPSSGTHISALLVTKNGILAALYGDGLWLCDGKIWKRDPRGENLPAEAREITALAQNSAALFVGTRRAGIFTHAGGNWQRVSPQASEPFNANIQNFAQFGGLLWASTLDDGLIYGGATDWRHISTPTLSSSAPRQMIEFQNQLFVRHGGGMVDSFDGRSWTKNALASMPRKGVYALAAAGKTLFAAGWGGWSEWDGTTWTPHFELPQLQNLPLMGLLPDGDDLWIATQSRGLGRFNRQTKTFRWFDERDGLPDDWVTALTKSGGKIYAGTFVGGLARLDGDRWHVFEALQGQNVTALVESGGKLVVSTRTGVWEIAGDAAKKIEKPWLDSEVQALWPGKSGLWVGARTSLSWLRAD